MTPESCSVVGLRSGTLTFMGWGLIFPRGGGIGFIRQKADLQGIWLPGGVRVGRSVPQSQSDLLGHLGAASQDRKAN